MRNWCKLNVDLLPIKLHFFFFYGAVAGVSPFMPVIAKGLGINATAFGLIYTVIPFCVFLSKPFFGYLTDYFQNIKVFVFALVLLTASSFAAILVIPRLLTSESDSAYDISCNPRNDGYQEYRDNRTHIKVVMNCSNAAGHNCSILSCDAAIYSTYQFWLFFAFAVISGTSSATVYCLTDTASYEMVKDRPELYGRQRVWATVSWGLITTLAGFLNDKATPADAEPDYSPGFYIMFALILVDLLLLLRIKLTKPDFTISICRDMGKIFSSAETVIFAAGVYVVGALTSLIWNYEFWFLEDLGASQTLLGLAVGVQCLVAEIPMFFFSGWFIEHLGHFYCLVLSFAAFSVRFLLYSFLKNPWFVLPVEVTQGFSYALFYASMTGYASANAPPGTEATMMGVLGGLFEGLGVATGSFVSGLGFSRMGGRLTFRAAAAASFVCVPLLLSTRLFLGRASEEERMNVAHKTYSS